jgi:hypothetical protein
MPCKPSFKSVFRYKYEVNAHSSPLRNSAVNARCSRDRVADSTPPYNSLSRTVPRADRLAVLYISCTSVKRNNIEYRKKLALNAKFLSAFATPGLLSNLLPALTKYVTARVG